MAKITLNSDYSDLLRAFNEAGVEYLVVGAHALASRELLQNKRASGRPKDLMDVEALTRLKELP